jgi:2-C-methyl-D-erythritol 4-phosphate cytidylyltransferase
MGFDKLFAPLCGQPVIAHSIAACEAAPSVSEIVLVGRTESLAELNGLVSRRNFRKVSAVVVGGRRRQDSVACGLEALGSAAEFVAVHDAARPLVRPELIERIYDAARTYGGAASGVAVVDTLKRVGRDQLVVGGVDRAQLFAVETPQIFRRDLLEKAYQLIFENGREVTDEISAVEAVGAKVMVVPNDEKNFKITLPSDLPLAEFILHGRG